MHILCINGSRRKNGNTHSMLAALNQAAEDEGATTETIVLGDYAIDACTGCEGCRDSWECVIKDDFAAVVDKIDGADALVLASPTYWYTVTSDMKRFIDRCYSLIQFPKNRHEWIGKYQDTGKRCVTMAVCEQHDERMAQDTAALLTTVARDLGFKTVDEVRAAGFFAAGCVEHDTGVMERAEIAGRNLCRK
jgi:multimeric flavodoxin WrbA